jgi:release factor glutamine methyltransferase
MNLVQIKKQYLLELANIYDVREIESFFEVIVEDLMQLNRMEVGFKKNEMLDPLKEKEFTSILEALKTKQPLQYILGHAWFYGRSFNVNPSVLIPRPETEELVQWIIQSTNKKDALEMLDIGTGSGCIPITLKIELPNTKISAIDISADSLYTASTNATLHKTAIQFQQLDILTANQLSRHYDVIVSNPPYIPEKEKSAMHENVLEHEPHLALFVPNEDPLLFYKKITALAENHLNKNGLLFFEIHYDQADAIQQMISKHGFEVELRKDIYGQDRMIKAKKLL